MSARRFTDHDTARKAAALLLILAAGTGCARYYYGKPAGTYADFRTDSIACARDFGIASGNSECAAVSPDLYRRCMLAKGWEREAARARGAGQFRGVEDSEPVSLVAGPPQPADENAAPRGNRNGRPDAVLAALHREPIRLAGMDPGILLRVLDSGDAVGHGLLPKHQRELAPKLGDWLVIVCNPLVGHQRVQGLGNRRF
jgi:hypothetical protein